MTMTKVQAVWTGHPVRGCLCSALAPRFQVSSRDPAAQDPDISMGSREEDDLPPLERARRRRSILPGGQTRLVPLQ